MPRLPDWLIYLTVVAALLAAALGARGTADAPPAPPPPPGASDMPLPPNSPFAAAQLTRVRRKAATGAAFSVNDGGVWLTSRRTLCGGRPLLLMVAEGRGVAVELKATRDGIAVLTSHGGGAAAPLATSGPRPGDFAFVPGFLGRRPGEAALRFIGYRRRFPGRVDGAPAPMEAWAPIGRTEDSSGPLSDLVGAPVLNGAGQVVGVVLGAAAERGRLYASGVGDMTAALAAAKARPSPAGPIEPLAVDSYGRVADSLRRDLTVAQTACPPLW